MLFRSVPAAVPFNVTDKGIDTVASGATVTATDIVLASNTYGLKLSIMADAADFTPPAAGGATYAASDIVWAAGTWTHATGANGVMSSSSYGEVATCAANASDCSTNGLVFTLKANSGVKYSGAHRLSATWKVESVVP